jgi:hypothetical protein
MAKDVRMMRHVSGALSCLVCFLIPTAIVAQSQSSLPAAGSYGVSFSLPSGGGAGFGVRKMLSSIKSVGIEFQGGLSWREASQPSGDQESRTDVRLGVSPNIRLYNRVAGPVVPFLQVVGSLAYTSAPNDGWAVDGGGGVGLGVEWLPLPGMSISGTTGVNAVYRHSVGGGLSQNSFNLGAVRSQLELNLYF